MLKEVKMDYPGLIKKAQQYIETIFEMAGHKKLPYHNKTHTANVVNAAIAIGNHYQLNANDFFVVTVAAWFHDIGYFGDQHLAHEINGASMAGKFLKERGVDEPTILQVQKCILATKIPQAPVTLCEQIVCDADLFHLGTDGFTEADKLMRKEFARTLNKDIDKNEWRKNTIEFLQSHHYHTEYCSTLLNAKKQDNLEQLIKKQQEKSPEIISESRADNHTLVKEQKEKDKKPDRPARGIETMFRIASANHQRLSDMADSKSHIMISVNSIIISVVIGLVVRKLETAHNLILPTMILLAGCVIAVIFSVLATRPKIPGGYFSSEQLSNRSVNLLFFGNFYKMGYERYYEGMKLVMNEGEFLYASLIRDIHSQGVVLGNKYKLLRISYTIFMFTLIASVLAFAISIILFE